MVGAEPPLVRTTGVVNARGHVHKTRVPTAAILYAVGHKRWDPHEAAPLLSEVENVQLMEGRAIGSEIVEHHAEVAVGEGQSVDVVFVIDPGAH